MAVIPSWRESLLWRKALILRETPRKQNWLASLDGEPFFHGLSVLCCSSAQALNTTNSFSSAHRRPVGFTLIELLVVLVILALFSGMVVLSIGDNLQRKLLAEAERVQSVIIAAADEAIYTGNELGLYLTKESYQVLRWDRLQSSWVTIGTPAFSEYKLPEGFAMEWTIDGFMPPDESEAIAFELGEQDDFGVAEQTDNDEGDVEVNTEGAVKIDVTPQILLLSSAELSVFELDIAPDETAELLTRVRIYSDGFSMPRIKQRSENADEEGSESDF